MKMRFRIFGLAYPCGVLVTMTEVAKIIAHSEEEIEKSSRRKLVKSIEKADPVKVELIKSIELQVDQIF